MPSLNCTKATKLANKATERAISSLITETYASACKVIVRHSNTLKKDERDRIWSIYVANMYELSKNSSFGWDPTKKRKEIFHSLSRFILVYDEVDNLLAFVMFRFEHEYDEDIVYCYEVQLVPSAQGRGLGKKLMIDLEKIAKEFNMEKITLTVLKSNANARSFYKSLGFIIDPSSPDQEGEQEVDYQILSRAIS